MTTYFSGATNGFPTMTGPETSDDWTLTLARADDMEAALRSDGWDVVTVRAGHVAPEPPSAGEDDRYGFVYVAQGSDGDELATAIDTGTFDEYTVFNRRDGARLYTITRVEDADRELAVLLVGAVDVSDVDELVTAARERDAMYSHVQRLDGTIVGTFEHDDPEPFLPEAA